MCNAEAAGRKNIRDILKYVDGICKENCLSYTLIFTSLLSQYLTEDISEWLNGISIAMFYQDYKKLLHHIPKNSCDGFYAVNYDSDNSFSNLYAQVFKKGRIELASDRKSDERYYDCFINIYPVFYIGNTKYELKQNRRKANHYLQCMYARKPVPYGCTIKNCFRRLKQFYYYRQRQKEPNLMEDCFAFLSECNQKPSKYVFLPVLKKQKGIVCLAKTYQNIGTYRFGNLQLSCLNQRQEWIHSYYTKKKLKQITAQPANRAVLEGPEILRRVQLISLEILKEFDRICRKHNIRYILAAGSLLGAVRHKGFIPWDDDTDVFILQEEWEKFEKIAPQEIDCNRFFIRTQETDKDDNLVFYQIKRNNTIYTKSGRDRFDTHKGIALDILPFYNSPKTLPVYWIQNRLCRFFKTATWAHMGAENENKLILRIYYQILAKISNKKNYQLYCRFARIIKKPGKYLVYLCAFRNPFHKGFNQRKYFENTIEMEFEGHLFPVPADYDEFLRYSYSENYMELPVPEKRVNHHMPGIIEIGDLFALEDEI